MYYIALLEMCERDASFITRFHKSSHMPYGHRCNGMRPYRNDAQPDQRAHRSEHVLGFLGDKWSTWYSSTYLYWMDCAEEIRYLVACNSCMLCRGTHEHPCPNGLLQGPWNLPVLASSFDVVCGKVGSLERNHLLFLTRRATIPVKFRSNLP